MAKKPEKKEEIPDSEIPVCGIIMPISECDSCLPSHWADVLEILTEATESVGFKANLVSNSDQLRVIHGTIIENLYENPIVVCDVSGKNANVMFELGMRLAFDKPTIVIKDDRTSYSFDTSPIEHLEYPRDLRFQKITKFKTELGEKLTSTLEAGNSGNYKSFLSHFGSFTVKQLESKEISKEDFMMKQLQEIRMLLQRTPHQSGESDKIHQNNMYNYVRLLVEREIDLKPPLTDQDFADTIDNCFRAFTIHFPRQSPQEYHVIRIRMEEMLRDALIKKGL